MNILSKKITAFTLAEVLIVLGIIGIIAALTIPTLINNTRDQELKVGLKKDYTVISQAFNQLLAEKGSSIENLYASDLGSEAFKNDLEKYLSVTKDCHGTSSFSDTGTIGNGSGYDGCWHKTVKYLHGGVRSFYEEEAETPGLILKDGTLVYIRLTASNCDTACGWIRVDVNGFKNPNQIGKDVYHFTILKNKIMPLGSGESNDPTCLNKDDINYTDSSNSGWTCAAKYLLNE